MNHRYTITLFFALTSGFITNIAAANTGIKLENAWVRSAPPTATVLAGYLTIVNTSDEMRTLKKVTSTKFEAIEVHRSEIDSKGMARMRKVGTLEIPSQTTVVLEPNSYHLMLINPKSPLGKSVNLVLHFDNGMMEVDAMIHDGPPSKQPHHH